MIFTDLDGPILDVSQRYYQVYLNSLAHNGKILSKDQYWEAKRSREPVHKILFQDKLSNFTGNYIKRRDELIESERFLKFDYVWQELRQIYQEIAKNNRVFLVTLRSRRDRTIKQLKNLGIHSWFRDIFSSPAAEGRERWETKFELINKSKILDGKSESKGVFIGDTETDIICGKRMGVKTVAVSFGIRKKEFLKPFKPDLIFDSPAELSEYLTKEFHEGKT